MMVESLLEIVTKRSQAFHKSLLMFTLWQWRRKYHNGLITMHNIVNQLGKRDFSYGSVVNNLKDRKHFSDQMYRNRCDPIPARHDPIVLPCRICDALKLWCKSVCKALCVKLNKGPIKQCGAVRKFLNVCSYHVTYAL